MLVSFTPPGDALIIFNQAPILLVPPEKTVSMVL